LLRVPCASASPSFRATLLLRTRRLLRRRRWRNRLALAAALAACYVLGVLTLSWLRPLPAAPPEAPVKAVESPTTALASATPLLEEWRVLDSGERTPEVYRQVGDRYVAEEGDYRSALRCYRDALDAGSEKDLAIAPGDSWLLMVLKDARKEEK
jgi:hypothetical protein